MEARASLNRVFKKKLSGSGELFNTRRGIHITINYLVQIRVRLLR